MLKFYTIFSFLQNLQRDTSSREKGKKKSKQHTEDEEKSTSRDLKNNQTILTHRVKKHSRS